MFAQKFFKVNPALYLTKLIIAVLVFCSSAFGQSMDEKPYGMSQHQWREYLNFKNHKDPEWAREDVVNLEIYGEIIEDDGFLNFPRQNTRDYFLSRNYISKYVPIAGANQCDGFDFFVIVTNTKNIRECTNVLYVLVDLDVGTVAELIGDVLNSSKIKFKSYDDVHLYLKTPKGWGNGGFYASDFAFSQISKMRSNLNIGKCPDHKVIEDIQKEERLMSKSSLGGRTDGAPSIDVNQFDGSYHFDEVWIIDASAYFGKSASIISLQRRQYKKEWTQHSNAWVPLPFPLNLVYMQIGKSYVPASLLIDVVNSIKPSVGPRGIRITDSFANWISEENKFRNRCFPKVQKNTP